MSVKGLVVVAIVLALGILVPASSTENTMLIFNPFLEPSYTQTASTASSGTQLVQGCNPDLEMSLKDKINRGLAQLILGPSAHDQPGITMWSMYKGQVDRGLQQIDGQPDLGLSMDMKSMEFSGEISFEYAAVGDVSSNIMVLTENDLEVNFESDGKAL